MHRRLAFREKLRELKSTMSCIYPIEWETHWAMDSLAQHMDSCKEVVKTDREEKGIGTAKRIETRHDLQFHGDKLPLARPPA